MANIIAVMGESGSGKSTSLRNLDPKTTYILDCDKKGLSWRGWRASYNQEAKNYFVTDDQQMVMAVLKNINANAPHVKTVVIDTVNGIMVADENRRKDEKNYDKWSDLAWAVYGIIDYALTMRDDLTVVFMAHSQTERDDSGVLFTRIKTSGKKLDKICLESKFTTVLNAKCVNGEHVFETRNELSTAKTPMGCFAEQFVPNDIAGDAAKVREEVASQLATIKSTLEADYARKTDLIETVSALRAEIERSAVGIVATVSQDYAKKSELTDVEASLEAKIALNADSITSTVGRVEEVEVDATEAKRAASAAEAAASKAKDDASRAASSAASAQTGADKAKADALAAQKGAAADKALRDYEDLEIRAEATDADLAKARESLEEAQASVAAAKAEADRAKADAGEAQTAADKARADAAAASAAAGAADEKAQGARDAVDEMMATIPGTYATKSEVKQESDRITATIEETGRLGGRMSKVGQTARGLSVEIEEVSSRVGNRNLILDSAILLASGLGSAVGSKAEYQQVNVGQSYMGVASGTEVTISFDLEVQVNTANPTIQVYNTNRLGPKQVDGRRLSLAAAKGTTFRQRCSVMTKVLDRADANISYNVIEFCSTYGISNWFKVSNLKMERGSRATDWSPAPEDASNAAKTATSVAEVTSAGVVFGNKTSGAWSGFRSRMAAGAFEVLNAAGAVVASYGASVIELGKNAVSSVIKMCGGKGAVSYGVQGGTLIDSA